MSQILKIHFTRIQLTFPLNLKNFRLSSLQLPHKHHAPSISTSTNHNDFLLQTLKKHICNGHSQLYGNVSVLYFYITNYKVLQNVFIQLRKFSKKSVYQKLPMGKYSRNALKHLTLNDLICNNASERSALCM